MSNLQGNSELEVWTFPLRSKLAQLDVILTNCFSDVQYSFLTLKKTIVGLPFFRWAKNCSGSAFPEIESECLQSFLIVKVYGIYLIWKYNSECYLSFRKKIQ